jgi:hypothetical protein
MGDTCAQPACPSPCYALCSERARRRFRRRRLCRGLPYLSARQAGAPLGAPQCNKFGPSATSARSERLLNLITEQAALHPPSQPELPTEHLCDEAASVLGDDHLANAPPSLRHRCTALRRVQRRTVGVPNLSAWSRCERDSGDDHLGVKRLGQLEVTRASEIDQRPGRRWQPYVTPSSQASLQDARSPSAQRSYRQSELSGWERQYALPCVDLPPP